MFLWCCKQAFTYFMFRLAALVISYRHIRSCRDIQSHNGLVGTISHTVSITLNCDQLECLLNWVRITRLNIVYQALFKFNHKSVERRLPVSDCHGPFFWCVLDSRVDDFLRWVIDWKQLALLNRLADNAVQRSDRVSRVNNLFDVSRIFKQCVQVVPVRMLWPSNKVAYWTRLKAAFLGSNLALRINKVSYWLSPYR